MTEQIRAGNPAIPTPGDGDRLERVNVMLSGDCLVWLDTTVATIRENTGGRISRSELLRGICGAFVSRKPQFTGCRNEADIRTVVGRLFDVYGRWLRANALSRTHTPKGQTG